MARGIEPGAEGAEVGGTRRARTERERRVGLPTGDDGADARREWGHVGTNADTARLEARYVLMLDRCLSSALYTETDLAGARRRI